MAGQEQGHHLIADLAVGEPAAVALVVHRSREQAHHIAVAGRGAALGDDAGDDVVEFGDQLRGRRLLVGRQPLTDELRQRQQPVGDREHTIQGDTHACGVAGDIEPEQRGAHDAHCRAGHRCVSVDHRLGNPTAPW